MRLLLGLTLAALLVAAGAILLPVHPRASLRAEAQLAERIIDLNTDIDLRVVGAMQKEQLGNDLAVGDLNADGILDIVAGAHWWTSAGRNIIGRSYALWGRAAWPAQIDLNSAPQRDWSFTGRGLEARLGSSVATGDIDDDGIDDLIMASVLADPTDPEDPSRQLANAGAIYIMLGSVQAGGNIDFLNSEPDIYIAGRSSATEADRMGTYLVTGDWNGDGKTDLAVSAVFRDGFTGRVYGWWGPLRKGRIIQLQTESASFMIDGAEQGSFFGAAMASGDLDHDGIADLAIAALGAAGGPENAGAVHVFRGGDDFSTLRLATDATSTIWGEPEMGLASALSPGGCSCRGQVLAIDDLTGDGKADLLAGASLDDSPLASNSGSVSVIAGPIEAGVHGLDDLPHLNIAGIEPSGRLGWSLATGDLNADRQPDLLIAAPQAEAAGRPRAGMVYGLVGPLPASGQITLTERSAQLLVLGSQSERGSAGYSLQLADTNGDGFDDLHVGVPDTAPLGRLSVGALFVKLGPLLAAAPTITPSASPTPASATPDPSVTEPPTLDPPSATPAISPTLGTSTPGTATPPSATPDPLASPSATPEPGGGTATAGTATMAPPSTTATPTPTGPTPSPIPSPSLTLVPSATASRTPRPALEIFLPMLTKRR